MVSTKRRCPRPEHFHTSQNRTRIRLSRRRTCRPGTVNLPNVPPDDKPLDVPLDLDDIQGGALHERPSPYVGTYVLLRVDDRRVGRELVRRLLPLLDSARFSADPAREAWMTVAFTYQGLKV